MTAKQLAADLAAEGVRTVNAVRHASGSIRPSCAACWRSASAGRVTGQPGCPASEVGCDVTGYHVVFPTCPGSRHHWR